jgi:hypothetical protein
MASVRRYSDRHTKCCRANNPVMCSHITLNRRTCLGRLLGEIKPGHKCISMSCDVQSSNNKADGVLLSLNITPVHSNVVL